MIHGITDEEKKLLKINDLKSVENIKNNEKMRDYGDDWDKWIEDLELFCSKKLICDVLKTLAAVIIIEEDCVQIEQKIGRISYLIKTGNLSRFSQQNTKDFRNLSDRFYFKIVKRIILSVNKYFEDILMSKPYEKVVHTLQSSSEVRN